MEQQTSSPRPIRDELQISPISREATSEKVSGWRILSLFFLIVAVVFCVIGLREMYSYEYSDKIVGGDAYNYTIIAARGTGLICAGVLAAVIAATLAIYEISSKQRQR